MSHSNVNKVGDAAFLSRFSPEVFQACAVDKGAVIDISSRE